MNKKHVSVERHAEMLHQKNRRFEIVDGQLFVRSRQWITAWGSAAQPYHLTSTQCHGLLSKLGGLWVQWTDGFNEAPSVTGWYSVVCRKHRTLEEIPDAKRRSELRRALRECQVRKVDAEFLADQCYETYEAAAQSYHPPMSIPEEHVVQAKIRSDVPFDDIRDHWAVFVGDKLVGFAHNTLYGTEEAYYSLIKLHPAYLKHYAGYALIFRMNEYYLSEHQFGCVNNGFHSLQHDTAIQNFLIKKFGFEKAYTNLHVHYRAPLKQLLRIAQPFRVFLKTICPQLRALLELDRARAS